MTRTLGFATQCAEGLRQSLGSYLNSPGSPRYRIQISVERSEKE